MPIIITSGLLLEWEMRKSIAKIPPQWLQQLDATDDITMATAEAQDDNIAALTGELQDEHSTISQFEDMPNDNVPEDITEEEDTQDDTDETVNKCYSLRNQDSIQLPGRFVNRVWDKLPPG